MVNTIVVPVYNSEKTIDNLVKTLIQSLSSDSLQIVLVNDGSKDKSHEVCHELALNNPNVVTYVNLSKNFGEHNAVMAGLNYAKGDYTVIMDDDFQNPPEEVLKLIKEAVSKKHDIVYTCYKTKQHQFFRNLGSRFNNFIANFMLDKPKDLYLSSFKCLSRFVVSEIIKYKGPFPYIDGLALRCTKNIGRIEASHDKRKEGRSGYTFRKLVRLWLNMFVNFSVLPLRISFLIGLLFSCLGAILSIFVIIDRFFHPETPLGYPSLFIAIMVFSGVQLLILGLLGEYLGHLFMSQNQTPQFVVREVYGDNKNAK
ncbi:glycosyltransferase [Candidatus Omnitrophota bacterium]